MEDKKKELIDKLVETYKDNEVYFSKDEIAEVDTYIKEKYNVTESYKKTIYFIEGRAFDLVEDSNETFYLSRGY